MIDHDGNFVAIALVNNPSPVVIPVSTIRTCIDMWLQFRFVFPFCSYCHLHKIFI